MIFCSCSSLNFLQTHYTVLLSSFCFVLFCFLPTSWYCSLPCVSQDLHVRIFVFSVISFCCTNQEYMRCPSGTFSDILIIHGMLPSLKWLIVIRLTAVPFNITVAQATTPHRQTMSRTKWKHSVTSHRIPLIRHRRRTFLSYKETEMQKWAKMLMKTVMAFANPSAMTKQMREDPTSWSLPPLSIYSFRTLLGHHKASRRWTWHSPNRQHHKQTDYILVRKSFRSGVNIAITRCFPGADIGNSHHLLMMIFHRRLKKKKKESACQNTQDSSLNLQKLKIPMCWKPPKLW